MRARVRVCLSNTRYTTTLQSDTRAACRRCRCRRVRVYEVLMVRRQAREEAIESGRIASVAAAVLRCAVMVLQWFTLVASAGIGPYSYVRIYERGGGGGTA